MTETDQKINPAALAALRSLVHKELRNWGTAALLVGALTGTAVSLLVANTKAAIARDAIEEFREQLKGERDFIKGLINESVLDIQDLSVKIGKSEEQVARTVELADAVEAGVEDINRKLPGLEQQVAGLQEQYRELGLRRDIVIRELAELLGSNLGEDVASEIAGAAPAGSVLAWPFAENLLTSGVEGRWRVCDGTPVKKSECSSELFEHLRTTYGETPSGDALLPNFQAAFLRGAGSREVPTGANTVTSIEAAAFNTAQGWSSGQHRHGLDIVEHSVSSGGVTMRVLGSSDPEKSSAETGRNICAAEARPFNFAVHWMMRMR